MKERNMYYLLLVYNKRRIGYERETFKPSAHLSLSLVLTSNHQLRAQTHDLFLRAQEEVVVIQMQND